MEKASSDEIIFIKAVPYPQDLSEAKRMQMVALGHHHDYWAKFVICDKHGNELEQAND